MNVGFNIPDWALYAVALYGAIRIGLSAALLYLKIKDMRRPKDPGMYSIGLTAEEMADGGIIHVNGMGQRITVSKNQTAGGMQ